MSSTYSTSLRIELIETGTADEAWGQPTDNNLGTIIEQAITGVNSISLTNLTSLTLSTANAAVDQARNAVLVFTGAPTANCNVIAPSVNKVYIAKNSTSGGYNVNLRTASGNAVTIGANASQLVYCDGTDFKGVSPNVIVGDMSVTGNVTLTGNVTVNSTVGKISNPTGNLTLTSTSNTVNFGFNTGALKPPVGGTAQRPATPANGMSRWNTDLNTYEIYNGTIWQAITLVYLSSYLIIAGGGGGGVGFGAGGGAGGVLYGALLLNTGNSYSIVVGGGGSPGVNGSNSSAFNLISIGGGAGNTGNAGGSGGGGGTTGAGAGTTGQGFAGGPGAGGPSGETYGGGGGGAGAIGGSAVFGTRGGDGGIGYESSITGTATYYAGGSAGTRQGIGGTGGTNGAGYLNFGGGGDSYNPGAGQNGAVIVSYANASQIGTGGTVTSYTSGGATYWVHTFTSSGTLTIS
jgi:hypothetical protein